MGQVVSYKLRFTPFWHLCWPSVTNLGSTIYAFVLCKWHNFSRQHLPHCSPWLAGWRDFGRISDSVTVCSAKLQCMCTWEYLLSSGNFRGRKLSRISRFCGEFSPQNFAAWCRLARQKRAIRESFLCENSRNFSPSKLFRYMVAHQIRRISVHQTLNLMNFQHLINWFSCSLEKVLMHGHQLCRPFIRLWIPFYISWAICSELALET